MFDITIGTYRVLYRPWPKLRYIAFTMLFELGGTVSMLGLTSIAQTAKYNKEMWQIGWDHRWNSNPAEILYAYANHVAIPTTPFVWSMLLVNYSVAISVLSLFMLLAKLIFIIMRVYYPVVGVITSLGMAALYAASVGGQAGYDYSDSRYPSPSPWFLRKGCSYARPYGYYKYCIQAQGTFATTVYMLAVYTAALGISIWAMWPNKAIDLYDDDDSDDEDGLYDPKKQQRQLQKEWEMQPSKQWAPQPRLVASTGFSQTPTPFTPRTQAFHTLDRKLPLRQ